MSPATSATRGPRLQQLRPPDPAPDEAVVTVHALSLNAGETRYVRQVFRAREVPWWDAAGVVEVAACDGSGPPAGTRVVTFDRGEASW